MLPKLLLHRWAGRQRRARLQQAAQQGRWRRRLHRRAPVSVSWLSRIMVVLPAQRLDEQRASMCGSPAKRTGVHKTRAPANTVPKTCGICSGSAAAALNARPLQWGHTQRGHTWPLSVSDDLTAHNAARPGARSLPPPRTLAKIIIIFNHHRLHAPEQHLCPNSPLLQPPATPGFNRSALQAFAGLSRDAGHGSHGRAPGAGRCAATD